MHSLLLSWLWLRGPRKLPFTQYIPGLYSSWSKVSLSYSEESTDQSYYLPAFSEEVEGRGTKKIAEDARLEVVELVLSSKFIQLQNLLSSHREAQTEKVGEQTSSPEKRADPIYNTHLAVFHHPQSWVLFSPWSALPHHLQFTNCIHQSRSNISPSGSMQFSWTTSQVGVTTPHLFPMVLAVHPTCLACTDKLQLRKGADLATTCHPLTAKAGSAAVPSLGPLPYPLLPLSPLEVAPPVKVNLLGRGGLSFGHGHPQGCPTLLWPLTDPKYCSCFSTIYLSKPELKLLGRSPLPMFFTHIW